jgi:hypothetical protein
MMRFSDGLRGIGGTGGMGPEAEDGVQTAELTWLAIDVRLLRFSRSPDLDTCW